VTTRIVIWCGTFDAGDGIGESPDFLQCRADVALVLDAAAARGVPAEHVFVLAPRVLVPTERVGFVGAATLDGLRTVAADIRKRAQAEDLLVFVATNHASPEGLATRQRERFPPRPPHDPAHVSCELLREVLDGVAGTQVTVFAVCFAGQFLSLGTKARTVFAVCDESTVVKSPVYPDPPQGPHYVTPFVEAMVGRWAGLAGPPVSFEEAFALVTQSPFRDLDNDSGEPLVPLRSP